MSAHQGSTHLVVGPFDMLHIGHLRLLTESGRAAAVRVGVLSDGLTEQLLGTTPFMPESERVELVAELSSVDGADVIATTDLRAMIHQHGISAVSIDAGLPVSLFETGALVGVSLPALAGSSSRLLAAALQARTPTTVHSVAGISA